MPRSRRRCGSHSGLARCPGSEVRCQSRGRFGEAGKARRRGIVGAIPRRSNAASVVETPPNLVTDFGFGTLGSAARRLTWRLGALLDDPPFDPPRKRSRGCSPALAAPWGGEIRRPAAGAVDSSGARQEPLHPVWSPPARHELLPPRLPLF